MWDKDALQKLIKEKMVDYKFIVVSNRQPFIHIYQKGKVFCKRGSGGVITALDPVMQACSGIWVAWGSGEADQKVTDSKGRIKVPPENPSYTLKRVWLSKEEEQGFYYGYSNEAIWPLCHMAFVRPTFRKEDWEIYKRVNSKFADAVLEEVGKDRAFVFIQDYHLTLLAKFLKERAGNNIITAHFWHIPWPNPETFRICPQKKEILDGLLHNDLFGLHIRRHSKNFLDCVDWELETKINRDTFTIIRRKRKTLVRLYPISVDFDGINEASKKSEIESIMKKLNDEFQLKGLKLLLGLDRIDYTKGICEKILAIDYLLNKWPQLKEKIVFLQAGPLSRARILSYKQLNDQINALVEEINWKHSIGSWQPIILVRRQLGFKEIVALFRMADTCVVTPLHDGMNLVAKEFVSTRSDKGGMLVLSPFTGSARELTNAIFVNPYDRAETAEGIYKALNMTKAERKKRMENMRNVVRYNNIYRWASKIISELLRFEFKE